MFVVIGASGLIGRGVLAALRERGVECEGTSSRPEHAGAAGLRHVDVLDRSTWRNLPSRPTAALVCVARSGLADCRQHPAETRAVNVIGATAIAREFADHGAWVTGLSSSFVFDGSRADFAPTDAPVPACEYGRQKVDYEKDWPAGHAIVRLTKVLDSRHPLVSGWWHALRAGYSIEAANDARLSLLRPVDVFELLTSLLVKPAPGIWHLSATDDLSWYDLACSLANSAGFEGNVCAKPLEEIDPATEFVPRNGTLARAWPLPGPALSSSALVVQDLRHELLTDPA
jgi:dTDP-4-dehydrorhamnose reductase